MDRTEYLLVYSSDLHGNEQQYQRLMDYAVRSGAQAVILGGDLLPKHFPPDEYIAGQRAFLEQRLLKMLDSLTEENIATFFLLGNDDAAANKDLVEKLPSSIHGRRQRLTNDFEICGYSYVPITPFAIKDWEKYDLSMVPSRLGARYEQRKKANYRLAGFKTTRAGRSEFTFTAAMEKKDSIQWDLENQVFTRDPQQTLYVIHTPPDNTALDQTAPGQHVGSLALRQFIEKNQPYVTLHGHIHETVEVSGTFTEKIGKTFCFSSGNDNTTKSVAVIVFDLYRPEKARRMIL
ncbi:MAG: metallophosphoesterase [Nanoarchaeota archaeon]